MDQGKRDKGSQMADSLSLFWSIRFLPQYLASEFYLIIKKYNFNCIPKYILFLIS